MSENIRPAVKALIQQDDRILVLKTETDNNTYWVLPGGKIAYGEEPVNALQRELQEEISCEAEIRDPVGMYHFFTEGEGKGDHIVLTVFEADIGGQEIDIFDNPVDEGITEYRWMKPDELIEKSDNPHLGSLVREHFGIAKK